jgi:hypothetical protein
MKNHFSLITKHFMHKIFIINQTCSRRRCRDGGGSAAAAGFSKFIVPAAAFFSRTWKKCVNLIGF